MEDSSGINLQGAMEVSLEILHHQVVGEEEDYSVMG